VWKVLTKSLLANGDVLGVYLEAEL